MVFSKVGASVLAVMRSISARFSFIAASSAGLKSATFTLSNGGIPPYGPSHFWVSVLGSAIAALLVSFSETVINRTAAVNTNSANRTKLVLVIYSELSSQAWILSCYVRLDKLFRLGVYQLSYIEKAVTPA